MQICISYLKYLKYIYTAQFVVREVDVLWESNVAR